MATGLVGTWRLVAHLQETVATGTRAHPRGAHPPGLLTYTEDGRFSIIAVPAGRRPPAVVLPTEAEVLALWRGLTAYAGRYSIAGDTVIHHVEVSWNELWAGTDQVRRFVLDGDKLTIIAGPDVNPRDGQIAISTLEWERVRRDD